MIRFAALAALLPFASALAAAPVWITNVKLVSPEKLDRIEQGHVLVQDGMIVSVQRGAGHKMPAGAVRVDGKGYYLSPGLIDSHVHLFGVPGMSLEEARLKKPMVQAYYRQMPRSFLYYGYTTVIDLALADRSVIDDVNKSPLHPDVVHCAEPLVMANGYPASYVAGKERYEVFPNFIYDPAQAAVIPSQFKPADYSVAAGIARVKQGGGVCVKTHFERGFGAQRNLPVMTPAMVADVRAEATRNKLTLVMHANGLEGQAFAVAGKVDVLAHGMWHWDKYRESAELPAEIKVLLDQIAERRIGYQATMQVLYGLRAYVDPAYLKHPGIAKVVPKELAAWFATPAGRWFKEEVTEGEDDAAVMKGFDNPLRRLRQVVAYLASKDANFLLGSDTPSGPTYGNLPGLNGFMEMQRLHEAGLSLAQVFKAATINNARAFKIDGRVGTIEKGKAANLVLMKMSPLADIAAYDSIVTVWVGGKQVEREALAAKD